MGAGDFFRLVRASDIYQVWMKNVNRMQVTPNSGTNSASILFRPLVGGIAEPMFNTYIDGSGDTQNRFAITQNGAMAWSSGTSTPLTLARNANNWMSFVGKVGINQATTPTSPFAVAGLPVFADNAAALAGGLLTGEFYKTSAGAVMVVN